MILVALLGCLLLALAVWSMVCAVSAPRMRTVRNLARIDEHGYGTLGAELPLPTVARRQQRFDSVAGAVGDAVARRFRSLREDEIQRRLIAAGYYHVAARRFLGYRVLGTIGVAVPVLLICLFGGISGIAGLAVVVAATMLAWIAPMKVVNSRADDRQRRIEYDLPELIDLLVVTVEAGLGFQGSLRLAGERVGGPLGDELRLTLQEQALGMSMIESLDHWLARCDTPSVRSFVRAVTQGERLGLSVGQILRNLALEMRKRRKAYAEERAQKAPVKILFPLVFLIFPALFVVVLGPALFRIIDALSGH
ncbi:MAG TPA: type II secretion system F family protein [Gaiellaceae bacterium]|jgi:tight adherence protein C